MRRRMITLRSILVLISTLQLSLGGLDDFGGDYGEYMNLLKGNSMLEDFGTPGVGGGTDDIEKGQGRQESVMGGGEFWAGAGSMDPSGSKLTRKEPELSSYGRGLKSKEKGDVHIHFDVNVLVNEAGKPKIDPVVRVYKDKKNKFEGLLGEQERTRQVSGSGDGKQPEMFDWKKMQGQAWPGAGTGAGAAGTDGGSTTGWGGKDGGGGGQSGGPAPSGGQDSGQSSYPPPPSPQAPAPAPAPNGDSRQGREVGKESLSKQMVVILNPELEVFHSISNKLDKAVDSKNRSAVENILEYLDKMGEKQASEKPDKYGALTRREVEEEEEEEKNRVRECGEVILQDLTDQDPWVTTKGLGAKMQSLSLTGTTELSMCSATHKGFNICSEYLNATLAMNSGTNMPFRGMVTASFLNPSINVRVSMTEDGCKISSLKLESESVSFAPSYDSSVPINPWSQVSLSGYLVSRVKKIMVPQLERSLLAEFKEIN